MAIRVGETGKAIVLIASFDMSLNTSLEIEATTPSGIGKTWAAALGVSPLTNQVLEDGTTVATVPANEWMSYELAAASDLDEAGTWTLVGVYNRNTLSPPERFITDPVQMTVSVDNIV